MKKNIFKTFLGLLKSIIIPQKKGDIRIRCANAIDLYGIEKNIYINKIDKNDNNNNNIYDDDDDDDDDDDRISISCIPEEQFDKKDIPNDNKLNKKSFFKIFLNKFSFKKTIKNEEKEIKKIEELEKDQFFISTPLDTFIGFAVSITGSPYMFLFVMLLLIGWIIWGAICKAPDNWQIVMQDGQSIQTYVWDTFLMRQQMDDNENFLIFIGKIKSRSITHKKLLEIISAKEFQDKNYKDFNLEIMETNNDNNEFDINRYMKFEKKSLFDKICDIVSKIVGSLPVVIIYWCGIFTWIGCGAIYTNVGTAEEPVLQRFSNEWQMYINTATAIILLFTSVFLENVRARTNNFIMKQMEIFNKFDCELELIERKLTNYYNQDNELVLVKQCPRDKLQNLISLYSIIIGNGLGLIISTCVFIIWFSIGNLMSWSSNWWLVIGTYTGLVGFIDGFVLREVYFSITNYEMTKFNELLKDSSELLDIVGIQIDLINNKPKRKKDLTVKISLLINKICSNEWSVVLSFIVVIGLVIFASSLLWSETAQLVANTPTMIIEGFFLIILIQAQNWASEDRVNVILELSKSRILLKKYINRVTRDNEGEGEVKDSY